MHFQRHGNLRETTDAPCCQRRRPRAAEMEKADGNLHPTLGAWQCPEAVEVMRVNKNKQVFN